MIGTPSERFWAKVDLNGPVPDYRPELGQCWVWMAFRHPTGHGQFYGHGERLVMAYRFAYEELVGPVPEGLELDHLCRVPPCVNPAHLEPVTHQENQRRGYGLAGRNARKTHCPQGHEYTPENTYHRPDAPWSRNCKTCSSQASARTWPLRGIRLTGAQDLEIASRYAAGDITLDRLAEEYGVAASSIRNAIARAKSVEPETEVAR